MPLLPSLFSNSLPPNPTPSLVLITDSLLHPGLLLLSSLLASSLARQESVILLSLEQTPSRLLPPQHDPTQAEIVDCVSVPFARATPNEPLPSGVVDVHAEGGVAQLEQSLLEAVRRRKSAGKGGAVVLFVDSVNELAEAAGVDGTYRILRKVLLELQGGAPGSRLVALHHPSFPSPTSSSLSLLPTLLSPSLSPSTTHLTLHPSSLLELLSRDYGLSISPPSALDIRLPSFLTSFISRAWGDPLGEKEEEREPLGGGGEGVVQWETRGVAGVTCGKGKKGERRLVDWGFEGVRVGKGGEVEGVGLGEVVRRDRMARVVVPTSLTPTGAPQTTTNPADPRLPFNLSLTDSQKLAREEVVLPYLPKEDAGPGSGGIEYMPDEGDDMDDDDPDEDLEI